MSHISSCSPGMRICDCPFWIICGESDEIGMHVKRIRVGGLREYHLLRTLTFWGESREKRWEGLPLVCLLSRALFSSSFLLGSLPIIAYFYYYYSLLPWCTVFTLHYYDAVTCYLTSGLRGDGMEDSGFGNPCFLLPPFSTFFYHLNLTMIKSGRLQTAKRLEAGG